MTIDDPNACSMPECEGQLGPEAMEFVHDGEPAGGICGQCLVDAKKIKVIFEINDDGVLAPIEMVHLGGM